MPNIQELIQESDLDAFIHLYQFDASLIGGGVFYFTSMVKEGSNEPVLFDGNIYVPVDFESDGWEWSGGGQLPNPKIRIANTTSYLVALLQQFDDLLGTIIVRIRTFRRYLDGEIDANPTMTFPIDVFRVDRKTTENKNFIELELAAPIEQASRKLPGRQILRDVCTHRYRFWDPETEAFSYAFTTCPYAGVVYFDEFGNSTIASLDKCGKRPTDCAKRFPNADLPGRFFPGVARVRIT